MSPADIDRVFGRGRLRMVTGDHVEVFREPALPGERRRYTKRFLDTAQGDFRHWTEREWRILARLVGHGIGPVPDVVQFDRGAADRPALVQTYDAGITIDHWATLLPVQRDAALLRHVFEDCAHWWALARHCLIALDAIHELQLVHLDLKADNVCIPVGPADFDPYTPGQRLFPRFEQIALIDFAFSLVSGESLVKALPIARQADYDYQSPRLLQALQAGHRGDLLPTRQLDWRCDIFSLAAMLRRYLPDPEELPSGAWTQQRHAQASALLRQLLLAHDAERPAQRPHGGLIALTAWTLDDPELVDSLQRGWTLATSHVRWADSPTPVTRIAPPLGTSAQPIDVTIDGDAAWRAAMAPARRVHKPARLWVAGLAAAISAPLLGAAWMKLQERSAIAVRTDAPSVAAAPVLASAPPEDSSLAPAVVTAGRDAPGRAATPPSEALALPEQAMASTPAVTPALPEPAAEPVTAVASPMPVPAAARARAAAPAPAPAPAAATEPNTVATPQPDAVRAQRVARLAEAVAQARAPAKPVARPRGRDAVEPSELARALAFLSARGPAPRFATTSTPPSTPPALAGASAPVGLAALPLAGSTAPAPALVPPRPVVPADNLPVRLPTDFTARAIELMSTQLPRVAQRAEGPVARVLSVAAQPDSAWLDKEIRDAAGTIRLPSQEPPLAPGVASDDAWRLNEAARVAYWRDGNLPEAIGLQVRAFGANPLNAEVAGNLAFLRLKQQPVQAESARQLALHALTLYDVRYAAGRIEDWTTLAIASALLGRDRDSRNAWFVSLALASNAERQCRAAVNAYAMHGERLRFPVEALLYRVHSSDRPQRSPYCEWPPHWSTTSQLR